MSYRLTVHKIDQSCLFELAWGQGQRLTASLAFPAQLLDLYESWRRAYLGYYKQSLRGRPGAVGQVAVLDVDWHSQLVQAEARLLSEFHTWLKHGDLFDLREELRRAAQSKGKGQALFLTCTPLELARLPWETWEFGPQMQIVRSPATIRSATGDRNEFRRGKARVLAILGDETGLNFAAERSALNAQKPLMDIHYVGWQPGENAVDLKQRICQTIADSQGWDVLFFAGHSNEEALLDGQVFIAPNTAISIKELSPYLQQAEQRGLQCALFNSCSGLDIAQGLVNLGLNQVVIMREPIHNEVAQAFLVQLVQRLARYENVQGAVKGTCEFLKLTKHLTYPSAYLLPSLFYHPQAVPYQLQPAGWRAIRRRWRPTQREAIALGALALLSLLPLPQQWLLDQRVAMQARYRDITGQVTDGATPPVVLVQVDQATFVQQGISDFKPIDRALLANIITRLNELNAPVIGIDYLLDLAQADYDATLNQALGAAMANQVWPVFITTQNPGGDWAELYFQVADPYRVLHGDAWVPQWHILPLRASPDYRAPFSYQLALAHRLSQQWSETRTEGRSRPNLPQPGLPGPPLEAQVQAYLREHNDVTPSSWVKLHPITHMSYRFRQRWLQPLLDFSIPPEQVYRSVSAAALLADPEGEVTQLDGVRLEESVVIVAAGGYYAAGVAADGDDNLPMPPALGYWFGQQGDNRIDLTGGEAHAYMTHHFLTDRLVVPIPDLWLILVATLGGKALVLYLSDRPKLGRARLGTALGTATVGYGWLSLQLYIGGAVLLPWLLPSLMVWSYALPHFKEANHEQQ
ncbi:CHASE2 domain-containing protein [Nodosilinea sp. FACHB-13]|uniref:CHASE2 domain-containing protein n=1 Tax=Cyanophyceae TaxID=3028117 RepID=UPI001685822D|nr:CHASE2 domain-containing protein [Nodosilinea sp. FACHB-13]MBD2108792.1 CHASE2 domain-containing protein [Nodosilinea sp. FACHB-13]